LHAILLAKTKKVSPIPTGFHTVTPYLSVVGGLEALKFYKKAFGAKEIAKWRQTTPDGKVIHARFTIGDSLIMLSDGFGRSSPDQGQMTLHIYTKNVDKLWRNSLAAGATVTMPLDDMYWGERYGQLTDPFGNRWSMSMRISMSGEEMAKKQKEAMKMFREDVHPNRDR
jgi:PhnB protein